MARPQDFNADPQAVSAQGCWRDWLRTEVTALGLRYVAGIQSSPLVWRPGSTPQPDRKPPKWGRSGQPDLISVKQLALGLPADAWHTIEWREGTADWLSSRFARVRVRVAHRYAPIGGAEAEWLLIYSC